VNIITTKLIADGRKADRSKTESIYINDVLVGRLTAYYDLLGRLECYNADLRCADGQWGASYYERDCALNWALARAVSLGLHLKGGS
jgi:hypothetical protein